MQVVRDLAGMMTVGVLVVTATCVPPPAQSEGRALGPARKRLMAWAQLSATLWAVASIALVAFIYSDASGSALGRAGFASEAIFFAFGFEAGQYGVWGAALAAAVAAGCALSTRMGGVGITTVLAFVALWPMALTGHAAGTLDHDEAVNLQLFHLVGINVWVGGLLALVLVRRVLGEALLVTVRRYSVLAGWCLALVTVSGMLGSLATASFGIVDPFLVRRHAGAEARRGRGAGRSGLVAPPAHHRRPGVRFGGRLHAVWSASSSRCWSAPADWASPSAARHPRRPARLRGHSPPRSPCSGCRCRRRSTRHSGSPPGTSTPSSCPSAPPPPAGTSGPSRGYGDAATRGRGCVPSSWLLGCLLFVWATSGAPGTYGRVLFSMHMVQHMTVAAGVPVFLVLGTPVTLALRVLRRRDDGSRGPREWLTSVTRSLPLHVVGHPIVAAGMFVVSMVGFYYTSAFELSLESHTAHVVMTLHFLLTGYLFAESVVGADPGLHRPPYPMRVLLIMVTFGFHALLAVSMMASSTVFAADWFQSLGRTWGRSPLEDQYLGAQVGWLMGEYPILVMAAALVTGWVLADGRESRRYDRREERDDDRELQGVQRLPRPPGERGARAQAATSYDGVSSYAHGQSGADRMRQLGHLEAVVMQHLWSTGRPVSVRETLDALAPERALAYTTVMTVMDNLHSKGLVAREKQGKAYLYTPVSSRDEHTAEMLQEVLADSDDRTAALMHLVVKLEASEAATLLAALSERADDPS